MNRTHFLEKYCNENWHVLHVIIQSILHWLIYIFSSALATVLFSFPYFIPFFGWVRANFWTCEITEFLSSNCTPSKSLLSLPNKKKSLGYIWTVRWVRKEVQLQLSDGFHGFSDSMIPRGVLEERNPISSRFPTECWNNILHWWSCVFEGNQDGQLPSNPRGILPLLFQLRLVLWVLENRCGVTLSFTFVAQELNSEPKFYQYWLWT